MNTKIKKLRFLNLLRKQLILCLTILTLGISGFGQSFQQVHDPSDPVYHNGRWWIYTTGDGIYTMSKTSLTPTTGWTTGPRVFPSGFPSWIRNYVSNFNGHFWAPHLTSNRVYYSCSSFGSKNSAIGMAEGTPGGTYVDRGMVIYSNNSTNQGNAIDPFVFENYLIYGSFFEGIFMVRLGSDGKPNTTNRTRVVGGGSNNAEAAFMTRNGNYYYMWFNRGSCCNGVNSTYHVQVGRSTSITGPFVDRNGNALTSGGGTTVLSTSGRYIGPGGSGVSGTNLVWHFYDGNANGEPRLMTGTIAYNNGWPCVTPAYGDGGNHCVSTAPPPPPPPSGSYVRIANRGTGLFIDGMGNSSNGADLAQWANTTHVNAQWTLESSGSYVRIRNRGTGLYIDGMGRTSNGAECGQWANTTHNNAQWEQISAGSGYYQFRNRGTGLYLDGMGRTSNGSVVGQWANTNHVNSHWSISSISSAEMDETLISKSNITEIIAFPNPITDGKLTIKMNGLEGQSNIRFIDLNGKVIIERQVRDEQSVDLKIDVRPGLYILQLVNNEKTIIQKVTVN